MEACRSLQDVPDAVSFISSLHCALHASRIPCPKKKKVPKHLAAIIRNRSKVDAKPQSPGSKDLGKSDPEALDELEEVEGKLHQQDTGISIYVSSRRFDTQFCVKTWPEEPGKGGEKTTPATSHKHAAHQPTWMSRKHGHERDATHRHSSGSIPTKVAPSPTSPLASGAYRGVQE